MEIYGFIPIIRGTFGNNESNIQLPYDRIFVEGAETAEKNVFKCVVTAKCCVTNEKVPRGDISSEITNNTYEKFVTISTGVTIKTNDSLDILTISPFEVVSKTGNIIVVNKLESTIVNLLYTHPNDKDIEEIVKKILDKFKDLPDLNLDAREFLLTNGVVKKEPLMNGIIGLDGSDRLIWEGDYPLDKLIYVIRSNLDILNYNKLLKDDQYAGYYAQLFGQAMQLAVDLEKHRITSLISLYLGLLKALGDYEMSKIQLASAKLQCRVYYAQFQGFKSNNLNKLFGTQTDGASSAFSAGMTDVTPPIFNDSTLMSLYSQVATSMADF